MHSKTAIVEKLRHRIAEMKSGDRLPTVEALSRRFGVSTRTLSRVIVLLSQEKVVYSIRGKGVFVAGEQEREAELLADSGSSAERLATEIMGQISRGSLKSGRQLPSVKYLSTVYHLSPATVTDAYRILQRRGMALKVGKSFWAGGFEEIIRNRTKREIHLFNMKQESPAALLLEDPMGPAFGKMEWELQQNGFILTFCPAAQFQPSLKSWLKTGTAPHGIALVHTSENVFHQLQSMVQQLKKAGDVEVPILVEGGPIKVIPGIHSVARGTLQTAQARKITRYFADNHRLRMRVVLQSSQKDFHVHLGGLLRLVVELDYPPVEQLQFIILDPELGKAARFLEVAYRKYDRSRILGILSKYRSVSETYLASLIQAIPDEDLLFSDMRESELWVCPSDYHALALYQKAQERNIPVPSKLALIGLENRPESVVAGLSCCVPDWETTGYLMAHALIGDFAIEKTSRGYIRIPVLFLDRHTT